MNTKYQNSGLDLEALSQIKGEKLLSFENFKDYESFYTYVFQNLFQSLHGFGMSICGNKDLVEDSIQELFLQFWKNRALTKIKVIKPYLFKCLKRKIRRTIVKEKRPISLGGLESEMSQETKLEGDEKQNENRRLLLRSQKLLTERQLQAIKLRFYSDLPIEDVAVTLKITTKATYKLIYRAIAVLRSEFRQEVRNVQSMG
ncbi:sigma-70 family RNA polymerase sigma factor [Flagellimonas hymeniacidonis]|uniref:Sigma-70 family RNA polymerase sigma factor n=1 Tax=Flagellimonas hymeniacidonis TaxID=2603628 RepID=A0A5C8V0Q3_9FLAO|nr:sigma-70 family RNA polymerase sigma factor [Flagellimonas hymeniacidonis]TXN34981.1 sigma-70 family RNA polymerase sigma factor [Flagellimonas hymeniacidonis]